MTERARLERLIGRPKWGEWNAPHGLTESIVPSGPGFGRGPDRKDEGSYVVRPMVNGGAQMWGGV